MTRTYPYPTNKTDFNFLLVTDIHHGRRPNWTPGQLDRAGADIDRMSGMFNAIIYGGDLINWHGTADKTTGPEDFLAKPWIDQRRSRDPLRKEILAYGNHDYACWEPPYNRRTIKQLEAIYHFPQNAVTDCGRIVFISISPDTWWDAKNNEFGIQQVSSSQVAWVKEQIAKTDKPVWLVTHAPIPEHYNGHMNAPGLSAALTAPNLMGVISGHRHPDIRVQTGHTAIISVGGRSVYAVNGASVGSMPNTGGADPWDMLSISTAVSIKGDGSITVRYRDHLNQVWVHSPLENENIITLNSGFGGVL